MPTLKQKLDTDLALILQDLSAVREELADPDGNLWVVVLDLTEVEKRIAEVRMKLIGVSTDALRKVLEEAES